MPRHISAIVDINKESDKWTVLIQVVERNHIQYTRKAPPRRIQRFVLTDSQGTKVSAATYENCIRLFRNLLVPYQRYYISGATVVTAISTYKVSEYPYSWVLHYSTLIERYLEPIPPALPCPFTFDSFSDAHKHAESDTSLISVKALVIYAFPQKETTPDSITRDFVIVNEEKKLMLLTLWNEFQEYEGNILANIIATIPMIFVMRVKVSTFNTLSLTTIGLSSILINPPLHDEFLLHEWYTIHKDEVKTLFETKAYKDPELLLPPPNQEDIKNIHDALNSFGTQKTAWITGTAQLSFGQTRFWYTACSNCLKTVEADTDWIIKCLSCKEEAEVELRCRIGITLTDSTTSIQCLISGKQAERLIQFTAAELKDAEAHGITMNQELSTIMKRHKLICFIKTYETTFQGLPQRRNAIIKAYTAAEVPNIPLPLQDSPTTFQASPSTTPSNTKQKQIADEQTFTPKAKLLLQEIAESTATKRSSMTESTATKRALTLTELEGHQIAAPTVGTEMHKTLEDTATSASPNATSIDNTAASPTKKPKQQEGN